MTAVPSLLEASGVAVEHGADFRLHGVNLTVGPKELVAVIGANGAGKTTLLRAVLGLLPRQAGHVLLGGASLDGLSPRERARRAAHVPQGVELDVAFSVFDVVAMGREPHRPPFRALADADHRAIAEALARTALESLSGRDVRTLSGGERQRVLLARALAQGAPLVVLDEPTGHLDLGHAHNLFSVVQAQVRSGQGALVAVHDLTLAARFADHLLVLHRGRVHATGSPREVLTEAMLAEVYGVDAEVTWTEGPSIHVRGTVRTRS